MVTLFFSRQDRSALEDLENLFLPKEGLVWFLESKKSGKWITVLQTFNIDEDKLTNNPANAKRFKTEANAITHKSLYKLSDRFIATEHEFVD